MQLAKPEAKTGFAGKTTYVGSPATLFFNEDPDQKH